MSNFMNLMKDQIDDRKTLTENGAVAYATSGKKLLDFYFAISGMRSTDENEIKRRFSNVYYENPLIAVKTLFHIRDCRGGNGERRLFRICMEWLAENKPQVARAVLKLVPEYARWDDLWCLLDTGIKEDVLLLTKKQFEEDQLNMKNGKPISLLAKWAKSINTSSKESRRIAEIIRNYLGCSPKNYRKGLSKMRNYIKLVEQKMAANQWSDIDYAAVPSQANVKYKNAFLRHDESRRLEYLDSLKKGETKINASVLQPHEIVLKYGNYYSVNNYDETLEQLWKALPNVMVDDMLVVRDGSGSMTWGGGNARPLDVATALAIYTAEHNGGIWKDKYITFSSKPKFVDLINCETLRDKLVKSYNEADCSNTNIEATMMLVLDTAINNNLPQEEMPGSILVISDMGFDAAVGYNSRLESLFDNIARRFKSAGYKMPKIVFWNVAGEIKNGIPIKENELGVVLMSGFSVQLLNMAMSNKTDPYEVLLETVNSQRYQPVEDALSKIFK